MINVIYVNNLDDVPKMVEEFLCSSNYESFFSICVESRNFLKKFKTINEVVEINYNTFLTHITKDFLDIVYNELLKEFDRHPQKNRKHNFSKTLSYVKSLCTNYTHSIVSALGLELYKPSNDLIDNLAYKVMNIVNVLIKSTESSLIRNTLLSSSIMYMQKNLLLDIYNYFGRSKLYLITFRVKEGEEFIYLPFILNKLEEENLNDKTFFYRSKLKFNPSIFLALSGQCEEYEHVIDMVSKGGLALSQIKFLKSRSGELGIAAFLIPGFFAKVIGIYKDAVYHFKVIVTKPKP